MSHKSAGRKSTGRKKKRKARPPPYLAHEALALLLSQYEFESVVDVGCGDGAHARAMRARGKRVTTISLEPYGGFEPDFAGDVFDFEPRERFDLVWCSHALEHQPNVALFLQRLAALAKPGGLLAITVPPARRTIVGGHLTVWNTGLLLYNLVAAGIDCSEARTREYGYNISLIVRLRPAALPPLRRDVGDIERLAPFFPMPVRQGFDGRIAEIGWAVPAKPAVSRHDASRLEPACFLALPAAHGSDLELLASLARSLRIDGHVAEFGVFKGRSIRELARALPRRTIHGFDSFMGLPSAWRRSDTSTYEAGHFAPGALPEVPGNVRLWPGFFEASVPEWLRGHDGPMALVHVDCDLYESTAIVLGALDERFVPGTVLVFDELCDWNESGVYPHWRDGEWRALAEWSAAHGRAFRILARGPRFSGAIEVLN
jgi:SAM-dependent methyltransferase